MSWIIYGGICGIALSLGIVNIFKPTITLFGCICIGAACGGFGAMFGTLVENSYK